MTIIAWDGKMLAADKQSTCAGHPSTVTKIFRTPVGAVLLARTPSAYAERGEVPYIPPPGIRPCWQHLLCRTLHAPITPKCQL